ncbi:hypothetical protein ACHAPD_001491 [Fusarium lateritium]
MEGYVARDIEESYRMNAVHNGIVNATRATPGQFGILAPTTVPAPVVEAQQTAGNFSAQIRRDGNEVERSNGQLSTRIVVDPPNLEEWRDKLFNVDEAIILTHEEFETYFPHVDNVYSHRSTQRYKHKPFISHYWDCRMKGRPPGTPKSVDPNKKKRKRSARQLDLCDVKIKITEHFPSAYSELGDISLSGVDLAGQRFWTIQRVNGNGGNGKGDGVAGPHKHTLQRSDEIKKSSVQRHLTKQDGCVSKAKEKAKGVRILSLNPMLENAANSGVRIAVRHEGNRRRTWYDQEARKGQQLQTLCRMFLKQKACPTNIAKRTLSAMQKNPSWPTPAHVYLR